MSAYYNENDPFAAAWLRELIKAKLIADGEVDERSIADVRPTDLRGFVQCHFFAGIGGWSYALRLAGWPDDREVWTGSCPCQPFSEAGRGLGEDDPRDLWPTWFRLIGKLRPAVVFGEQVARAARSGWLDRLFANMETLDYACGAIVLGAHSARAFHRRQRLWFVADAIRARWDREWVETSVRSGAQRSAPHDSSAGHFERDDLRWIADRAGKRRPFPGEPAHLADGISAGMADLSPIGNAIVPQVAQAFIEAYLDARSGAGNG